MDTCFPSSNSKKDSATMLYLRVPSPGSYSETPVLPGNMMMYMNYSSSSDVQPVGALETNEWRQETLSSLVGSRTVDHDFSLIHPMSGVSGILQAATNLEGQGLSLSLGTHGPSRMNMSSIQYMSSNPNFSPLLGQNPSISGETRGQNGSFEENNDSQIIKSRYNSYMLSDVPGSNSDAMKGDIPAYGVSSIASVIPNSKYLKAAQQLLDEVVNVRQAIMEQRKRNKFKETDGGSGNGTLDPSAAGTSSIPQESSSISPGELSAAKKQDVTKLIAMLDEVDRSYPKDFDKTMLARQTGLTRSQVSNWFINARVRLWKPMVEEMYNKEVGDVEIDSNSSSESAEKASKTHAKASEDLYQATTSTETEHCRTGQPFEPNSDHVHGVKMVGSDTNPTFQNLIRAEPENGYVIGQCRVDQRPPSIDDRSLFPDTIIQSNYVEERFMADAYQISKLERSGNGNGVSLTLGLQGGSLPVADETHPNFVTMRGNDVYTVTAASTGIQTPGFDFTDPGNRQHEFVPSRILHDFVA